MPGSEYLASARAKLKHSARRLCELQNDIDEYLALAHISLRIEEVDDRRADGSLWVVSVVRDLPLFPGEELGLVAGEALASARSALDHLVYGCALAAGVPVTEQHGFPIRARPPANRDQRRSFEKKLAGLDPRHVQAITDLQPYRTGSEEAKKLLWLNALRNLDEHRVVIPTFLNAYPPTDGLTFFHGKGTVIQEINDQPLAPGVWMVRIKYLTGAGHVWLPSRLGVTFMSYGIEAADLVGLRSYVVGIIESFGLVE